jgi:hypothetical protein
MIQGIKMNNPAVPSKSGDEKKTPTKKAVEKLKEITKIDAMVYRIIGTLTPTKNKNNPKRAMAANVPTVNPMKMNQPGTM